MNVQSNSCDSSEETNWLAGASSPVRKFSTNTSMLSEIHSELTKGTHTRARTVSADFEKTSDFLMCIPSKLDVQEEEEEEIQCNGVVTGPN